MKLVIFGSRPQFMQMTLEQQTDLISRSVRKFDLQPTLIISGMAQGIDSAAILFARRNNLPIKGFSADWNTHGRAAGKIRNKQMAMEADVGLGLQWNGSPGTQHMIECMRALRKLCYTVHDGELDYAF